MYMFFFLITCNQFRIKIWNLADPLVKSAIKNSNMISSASGSSSGSNKGGNDNDNNNNNNNSGSSFIMYTQQSPLMSTTQVHHDYIDCVRWVGNLILSKSTKVKKIKKSYYLQILSIHFHFM